MGGTQILEIISIIQKVEAGLVMSGVAGLTLAPGRPDSPVRPGSPVAPLGPAAPATPRSPGAP